MTTSSVRDVDGVLEPLVGDVAVPAGMYDGRTPLRDVLPDLRLGSPVLIAGNPSAPRLLLPSDAAGKPASRQIRDVVPGRERGAPLLATLRARQALTLAADSHAVVVSEAGAPLGYVERGSLARAAMIGHGTSRETDDERLMAGLHDLGNALQIVISSLSGALPEEDARGVALDAIDHAVSIQRTLLGRRQTGAHHPLTLDGLVSRHAGLLEGLRAEADGVVVHVEGRLDHRGQGDDGPAHLGDAFRRDDLDRMAINLARNALRAGSRRVDVVWFLTSMDTRPVLGLSVRDDGPGIPVGDRGRIFGRGFSSSGQPSRGLGLVSVLALVERYGGRLHLDSAPGRGTVFRIDLPLAGR